MDFFSVEFFVFSFAVLAVFYLLPGKFRWFVLLAASYFFYSTFKASYLALIIFSTLSAYLAALGMERWSKPGSRKLLLALALICNLGLLFIFKYFDFLDTSIQQLLGWTGASYTSHALKLIVPVGISFYVFQIAGYLIDVYRQEAPAEKHPGIFALYVAFFPKLLSGPIERVNNFLPQLREESNFDMERFTNGLKLICWGLFKKLVIADRLAAFVNMVHADPTGYSGPSLVLAIVFYSFQLYCDFSGYTDIAIGLAQMFGFKLADNFNRPWSATSVSDWWRRWHITMSTWFKDYLYITLGGSRVGRFRHYLNWTIVFVVCGLWHGASWTYVFWGLSQAIYLIIGHASAGIRAKWTTLTGLNKHPRLYRRLQIWTTFALISLSIVIFRAESLSSAYYILTHLHTGWGSLMNADGFDRMVFLTGSKLDLLIALAALIFMGMVHKFEDHATMRNMFADKPLWIRFGFYYVIVAGILLLNPPDAANFIYFQF